MHTIPEPPALVKQFDALQQLGWQPGVPAGLQEFAQTIDRGICEHLVCGSCKSKGLNYQPYRRGLKYKAVAVCPRCAAREEL